MGFSVKDPIRGSITGNAGTVNNHTVNSDVPANAKFTDTTYESKAAASGGTAVSLVTTGEKYTWNNKGTGTITKVQANGTDVASSGTANIPAASTGAYGVTKLSDATNSTSTALAATANAVKKAYDLANTANTGLTNKLDTYNGEIEAPAEGTINWHNGTLEASSYDNFNNNAQFQLYKNQVELLVHSEEDGDSKLQLKPGTSIDLIQQDADNIYSSGLSLKNDEAWLSTNDNDREHSTYIRVREADRSIQLYGGNIKVSQAPTADLGIANKKYVDDSIAALPEPMVFKGSLGTGGTITSLPTAAATNEGHTYKVITAGTYASQAAKAGDAFICAKTGTNTYAWTLIPSGDEPSGTVTSVTLKATSPIAIDSSSAITTSGTRTLSHANSGVTAGTYRSVTVNATGHVTAGTNPTTLSGYGITDAKIASGVITLGNNTVTVPTKTSELTNDNHFNYSIEKASGTIDDLAAFTSGKPGLTGSINLTKKSSGTGSEIPTGWYNYYFSPHRTGVGGDNGNYGTIILTPMNFSGSSYILRRSSSATTITDVKKIAIGDDIPTKVSELTNDSGYTTNTGTITGIKMNGASKGTSGVVDLGTVATTDTKYTAGTGLTLDGTQFKVTSENVSTMMNLLGEGTSQAQGNDYLISQYAGGGTTTTTYYRRKVSNVVNSTVVKAALGTDGSTTTQFLNKAGNWATPTDTKNTTGSTDTSSKIFLIGATSQAANPQTYSDNEVYATSGVLTTKSVRVGGTAATMQYNSTDKCIEFIFS